MEVVRLPIDHSVRWLTSVVAYTTYYVLRLLRGVPQAAVRVEAMLPAMCSGIVGAVAGAGSMLATDGLGYSVGYPLTLNGAFLVNVCWAVFYYREVRGAHNLNLFLAAIFLDVLGTVLISLSK